MNDPEAAKIVFDAPWQLTMVGLDVTRHTIMTPAYIERLCSAGNRFTDFIQKIVPFYLNFYRTVEKLDGFPPFTIPQPLLMLLPRICLKTRALHIEVEDEQSAESWTYGRRLAAGGRWTVCNKCLR